jgi:CheY-like chemotaxis protein
MTGDKTFLEDLQKALNHLNDPAFRPAATLCQKLGVPAAAYNWAEPLRQAIQRLQPTPSASAHSRGQRLYQVLLQRYIHNETQESTAEQLHITARHLRREQTDAVQALARLLWDYPAQPETPTDEWSAQLRQELTALQRGTPSGTSDAGETIQRVVDLLAPVQEKAGIFLRVGTLSPGLAVAVHPAGLRQLLLRILTEWSRHLPGGEIDIGAGREGEQVWIRLAGSPVAIQQMPDDPLLQELLSQFGASLRLEQSETATHLTLSLAAAPPIRVLVVDDNEDLLHFYRRYVANTRYQIIPLTDGDLLLETLEAVRPDVIVLDVMLPTADGWELLTHLRQHPLGRTLPILVCSVIQEEELARALGASGYIRKPVGRQELLRALNAALAVTPTPAIPYLTEIERG